MEVTNAALNWALIVVGIITGLVAIIAPIAITVRLILTPIDRAAKLRNAPPRFSVGDFLCLFLAIQIPLAAISRLIEPSERNTFWLFTIATWIIGPLTWITCARTLSKAGIEKSSHRLLFMGFVMPVVYYGLSSFTCLCVTIVITAYSGPDAPTTTSSVLVSWAVLMMLLILSWYFTKNILSDIGRLESELGSRSDEGNAHLQIAAQQTSGGAQVTAIN